jgi:hypothetical protein
MTLGCNATIVDTVSTEKCICAGALCNSGMAVKASTIGSMIISLLSVAFF